MSPEPPDRRSITNREFEDFVRAMPKAELHVHLEGSIEPRTLLALARRNGVDLGPRTESDLRDHYQFRDFGHFMQLYGEMTYVLREPEDFVLVVEELGASAAAQNIRYLEATFTAGTHKRFKGIPYEELLDAIWAGALSVERQHGVVIRFVLDHVRGFPLEDCFETVAVAISGRDRGVVGLGLAGPEGRALASAYGPAIAAALAAGVPFVPHAGEITDANSIWDALQFHPRRIGHGIRAVEDDALVRILASSKVVLEMALTSNVLLGAVADYASHPVRTLSDKGVMVTLNTDDPPMFGTSLTGEYLLAALWHGFGPSDLAQMSLRAMDAALLSDGERKERLRQRMQSELRALGVSTE